MIANKNQQLLKVLNAHRTDGGIERLNMEPEKRACQAWALLGAILIGVSVPTVLVCWNSGSSGPELMPWHHHKPAWKAAKAHPGRPVPHEEFSIGKLIGSWIWLQVVATIGCGPGALILGQVVYARVLGSASNAEATLRRNIVNGIFGGALLAFFNLPGYYAPLVMVDDDYRLEKLLLLFAVAGASSGAWIAWQAWRAVHPEENFWPRFSLGTLMIAVFAWGALLAVFAPK